jgi:hypothetical protein
MTVKDEDELETMRSEIECMRNALSRKCEKLESTGGELSQGTNTSCHHSGVRIGHSMDFDTLCPTIIQFLTHRRDRNCRRLSYG